MIIDKICLFPSGGLKSANVGNLHGDEVSAIVVAKLFWRARPPCLSVWFPAQLRSGTLATFPLFLQKSWHVSCSSSRPTNTAVGGIIPATAQRTTPPTWFTWGHPHRPQVREQTAANWEATPQLLSPPWPGGLLMTNASSRRRLPKLASSGWPSWTNQLKTSIKNCT